LQRAVRRSARCWTRSQVEQRNVHTVHVTGDLLPQLDPSKKGETPQAMVGWDSRVLPSQILGRLPSWGIGPPTSVQAAACEVLMDQDRQYDRDKTVLLQAVTGSGKTLAYLMPALARVDTRLAKIQAAVVVPTRELAVQVASVAEKLASGGKSRKERPLVVRRLVGLPAPGMISRLQADVPHVVIATPVLLQSLVEEKAVSLSNLHILVLDEADELLRVEASQQASLALLRSTRRQRERVLAKGGGGGGEESKGLQHVFVSASLTSEVYDAVVSPRSATVLVTDSRGPASDGGGGAQDAPSRAPPKLPDTLTHYSIPVGPGEHGEVQRVALLSKLHAALQPKGATLVFVNGSKRVPEVLKALRDRNFKCSALTATYPTERKERAAVLRRVKSNHIKVLVCTEMGARGLDIPNVRLVVNLEAPPSSEAYLHRAGRAGRCAPGRDRPTSGVVATFCNDSQDEPLLQSHSAQLDLQLHRSRLAGGQLHHLS